MQFAHDLRACGFATGVAHYSDTLPGRTSSAHVVLTINIGGGITTQAIMDTGSTWCILNPNIVTLLGDMVEETYKPTEPLIIRGIRYEGRLVRVAIRLYAEVGTDLEIEATAFVPTLSAEDKWDVPDFIGLTGFLQRIRFAVDPRQNLLYFAEA